MYRARTVAALIIVLGLTTMGVDGYGTYARWGTSSVDFYINPSNADASDESAEAALVSGAALWTTQSNASFRFAYVGRANDTSTTNDGRNVVFFRNTTNGGAIATTYSWWSGDRLLDADIIFWDGGFTFFGGSSGCGGSNAAYIEDIAAHEFGHALGLSHSTVAGATMVSGYSTCSMTQRTIEADDIAGIESLYPPGGPTTANTAPSVTVSSPSSGASFTEGNTISFTGAASDREDGDLGSHLVWISSRDGQIGTGGTFQRALSAGTHVITARVTDSYGATTETQRNLIVESAASPSPTTFQATGKAYKVKGLQKVDLTWSGATSAYVDVYRGGVRVGIVANTGGYTDPLNQKGGGSYSYVLCHAGTSTCSNTVKITF
jgi:hypothetical protein